jgi:hypothetical protein
LSRHINDDLHWQASLQSVIMAPSWMEIPSMGGFMGKNCSLIGWFLVIVALLILAAEGNFGWLAVLIPVSLLLACVIGLRAVERS